MVILKGRMMHGSHLGMLSQEINNFQSILYMTLHT